MKELYAIDKSTLDAIGNAIRAKKGTTEPIPVTSIADEIASIGGGSAGVILQAGTYNLVEFQYEDSHPGSFAWKRQNLHGMFWGGGYGENERPFTYVEAYDEWCVCFVDEVDAIDFWVSPSFNPDEYPIKVILEEAQLVSTSFSAWFNACFTKVEDEGAD